MGSKNSLISKLARNLDATGDITADAIASTVSLGAKIYASRANLPSSGNTAGDQAYVTDSNRLYIWNGSGWYNIALLNVAPAISSVTDSDGGVSPFALSIEGVATTITITAADSDGDPITYSATADSDFNGLATISQVDNVFTITPFSQDSASTTSGTITFTATDGINVASSGIQTFTLNFVSPLWNETVLSVGTSSTNGATNDSIVDNSDNAFTFTKTGTPTLSAFHPYLDYYSASFNGDGSYLSIPISSDFHFDTGEYTVECWVKPSDVSSTVWIGGIWSYTNPSYQSWGLYISGGKWKHTIDPADTVINTSTSNAVAGVWTHIAIVRSGDEFKLFVNGTLESDVTSAGYNMQEGGGFVGIGTIHAAPSGVHMRGQIADFHVIKGHAKYTSTFTPPTEPITPHANTVLLTCRKNRFYDESTTNKTITINGSNASVSALNPFGQLSEYSPGANKGSVEFKNGDSLTRATTGFYTVSSFCMEFWIYPLSDTTHYICEGTQQGSGTWRVTIDSSTGYIAFAYAAGSWAGVNFNTGTGHFNSGEWTHIAITKNSSGVFRIFVNGTQQGTQTNTSGLTNTGRSFQFGYYVDGTGTTYSDALFSDFKITRQDPVYESDFSVPTSPVGGTNSSANDPYMYLPFDNAGIYDKTGNNTLTLNGNTATSTTQTKFADTAMYFDGSSDWIRCDEALSSIASTSTHFTIEGWGYALDLGGDTAASADIIGINRLSDGYNVLTYGPRIARYSGAAITVSDWSLNQWTHFAITYDGTTYRIFINGSLNYSTTNAPSNALSDCSLYIGAEADAANGGSIGNYFNGYLENIQILAGVAKYTANFTPPTQTQGRTYQAES